MRKTGKFQGESLGWGFQHLGCLDVPVKTWKNARGNHWDGDFRMKSSTPGMSWCTCKNLEKSKGKSLEWGPQHPGYINVHWKTWKNPKRNPWDQVLIPNPDKCRNTLEFSSILIKFPLPSLPCHSWDSFFPCMKPLCFQHLLQSNENKNPVMETSLNWWISAQNLKGFSLQSWGGICAWNHDL